MSEIKVNKISPKQTCTQLTLGDSGDTIIIPSGATITNNGTATGFGRTGTVNWDTTKKTTGFTAVSGVGYFCDTTSTAFTATLPLSPSAGAIVAFSDYTGTWATNNITVGRNGSNINAAATDLILNINNTTATLIYVDATEGWRVIDTGSLSSINSPPAYVTATGGTVLTCGDYKTHVFTGPGTFTVTCAGNSGGSNSVEYLVVAGGGGGGGGGGRGGGGGAGGFRQNYPSPSVAGLPVTATAYPITIGSGGAGKSGNPSGGQGGSGTNSVFSAITSAGGGGGGGGCTGSPNLTGVAGGSGGGAGNTGNSSGNPGGAGNTPPVSPSQGNPGGANSASPELQAGGGGAGAAALPSSGQPKGTDGGIGSPIATAFFGPTAPSYGTPGPASGRYFAGGGGAANDCNSAPGPQPQGGSGGGGNGQAYPTGAAQTSGTANTGGGGGGNITNTSGAGGSGIVVIRYKFQ
jgi:hypothetical protein